MRWSLVLRWLLSRSRSLSTRVLVLVVPAVVPAAPVAGGLAASLVARSCWLPPVEAPVIDPFREPACPWCPGNRGLEYGTGPGVTVRAVATGVVTFSGEVAGVGYVVVRHADGLRATYGGITGIRSVAGDVVVARSRVGITARDLHFGLRDGDRYLDPAPHLGQLVPRPRLIPVDGTPARPAPPPRLRCGPIPRRSGTLPRRFRPPGGSPRHPSHARPPSPIDNVHPPLLRSPEGAWGRVPQPQEEIHHGRHHHAPDARGRRPLRAPDPTLEPEDEAVHLR